MVVDISYFLLFSRFLNLKKFRILNGYILLIFIRIILILYMIIMTYRTYYPVSHF